MPFEMREIHRMFPQEILPGRSSLDISPEVDRAAQRAIEAYKQGLQVFLKKGGIIVPDHGIIIPGDVSAIAKLTKEMGTSLAAKHAIAVRAQDLELQKESFGQIFHPSDIAFLAKKDLIHHITVHGMSSSAIDSNQTIDFHVESLPLGLEEMTSVFLKNLLRELSIPFVPGPQERFYFDDPMIHTPAYAQQSFSKDLVVEVLSKMDGEIAKKLDHLRSLREKAYNKRRHISSSA